MMYASQVTLLWTLRGAIRLQCANVRPKSSRVCKPLFTPGLFLLLLFLVFGAFFFNRNNLAGDGADAHLGDVLGAGSGYVKRPDQLPVFLLQFAFLDCAIGHFGEGGPFRVSPGN